MLASIYDPFTWRINELEALGSDGDPEQRERLLQGLLVAEAEEAAMGRHHLTIVHGDPTDLAESELVDAFYDAVAELAAEADWCRLGGTATHLTVTLAGCGSKERLADVVLLAERANPGHWHILETARR